MKRRHGQGSITPLKDGRFWIRGPRRPDGSRPSLGYAETLEQAETILAHGAKALQTATKEGCPTFLKFGEDTLDEREKVEGVRGVRQERNRFKVHLATARFANKPIDQVTTVDGAAWLRDMAAKEAQDRRGKRKVGPSTIHRALSLALAIFDAAGPQGAGFVPSNPFLELRVKRKVGAEGTKEKWTFLTVEEQEWFRFPRVTSHGYVTEAERLALLVGAGSGIRQGEQFNLELDDVHLDENPPKIVIRYGSKGLPRKNGKPPLDVYLFGLALEGMRTWLPLRARFAPDSSLVFPSLRGCRRAVGKPFGKGRFVESAKGTHVIVKGKPVRMKKGGTHRYLDRFKEVCLIAGITRNVRWHDASRHTCCSSLVQGVWGEAWSLEEIREHVDHSSITVTQRYAHHGDTSKKRAVAKVQIGGGLVSGQEGGGGAGSSRAAISCEFDALESVGRPGLEPGTYGLKERSAIELLRVLARENSDSNQSVTQLANVLASLLERGGRD